MIKFNHDKEILELLRLLKWLYEFDSSMIDSWCINHKMKDCLRLSLIKWVTNCLSQSDLNNDR